MCIVKFDDGCVIIKILLAINSQNLNSCMLYMQLGERSSV